MRQHLAKVNDIPPFLLQPLKKEFFKDATPAMVGERMGKGSFETKASRFLSGSLVLIVLRVAHKRIIQVEERGCLSMTWKMGQLIIGGLDSRSRRL